jgi:beta-galactosidase
VAYKNGKKITSSVTTTGKASRIVLTPSKTSLVHDGEDAVVVNVTVVDEQGREVPDAGNNIRFQTEGDATVIGVGNGDPSSHEPDKCIADSWQRHLFSGKAQVIVKAGTGSGKVTLKASGEGVQAATLTF